jgi:hypothetical protein
LLGLFAQFCAIATQEASIKLRATVKFLIAELRIVTG